jgi:O-antigen ligase
MPPTLALLLWFVLLLVLLRFDPAKDSGTSWGIWVAVFWMFIVESRSPSLWLGGPMVSTAQAIEEGNPLDRAIFFGLILLSIGILSARSFRWQDFFARNFFLTAFLLFGLVSFVWSDFPFVAIKRWFRDLGCYLTILIVLSDGRPLASIQIFLRRLYYLLIPLSVLLIKYYPFSATHYDVWTGVPEYTGAAMSKNTLGGMCLLSGTFFFWDMVTRWSERKDRRTRRIILVDVAFMLMTLWLLNLSSSATSQVCLVVGCMVIVAAHSKLCKRNPTFLKLLIPASFSFYLILAFGLGFSGDLAGMVGRDSTLHGRTDIWEAVLSTNTNPLIGTGYESFWLGPRLDYVGQRAGYVNEAHNGYIEFYLDFGIVGLLLLGGLLLSTYRSIWRSFAQFPAGAVLSLATWGVALFYNMTEAAFKPSFMCLTLLLGAISIPVGQPLPFPQRYRNSTEAAGDARRSLSYSKMAPE